jgi:hypothetical protein
MEIPQGQSRIPPSTLLDLDPENGTSQNRSKVGSILTLQPIPLPFGTGSRKRFAERMSQTAHVASIGNGHALPSLCSVSLHSSHSSRVSLLDSLALPAPLAGPSAPCPSRALAEPSSLSSFSFRDMTRSSSFRQVIRSSSHSKSSGQLSSLSSPRAAPLKVLRKNDVMRPTAPFSPLGAIHRRSHGRSPLPQSHSTIGSSLPGFFEETSPHASLKKQESPVAAPLVHKTGQDTTLCSLPNFSLTPRRSPLLAPLGDVIHASSALIRFSPHMVASMHDGSALPQEQGTMARSCELGSKGSHASTTPAVSRSLLCPPPVFFHGLEDSCSTLLGRSIRLIPQALTEDYCCMSDSDSAEGDDDFVLVPPTVSDLHSSSPQRRSLRRRFSMQDETSVMTTEAAMVLCALGTDLSCDPKFAGPISN